MEFRQLEAYIKVVELCSFSKAARELHVSQPSVSTYINSLERELGIILLNRSTKTVSPTLAGERFLKKAKELIALRASTVESMKELSSDHNGQIHIIASSVPAAYLLPRILADFHVLYPGVSFVVEQADTAQTIQAIASNKADIGFAGSIVNNDNCSFSELSDEELIFIGAAHSSRPDKIYSLEELLYSNCFIAREKGSGTRIQYEHFFNEHNIDSKQMNICVTMSDTQSIINAAANGLGISLVSKIAARDGLAAGQIVELRSNVSVPHRKIYTVLNTKVSQSHLVKLFKNHLTDRLH